MGIFKVMVKEFAPLMSLYLVDIPSDEYVESMVIDKLKQNKVNQISSDYDGTQSRKVDSIIFFAPFNIKQVRLESKAGRLLLKAQKDAKKTEEKSDKKAQSKLTIKDKK